MKYAALTLSTLATAVLALAVIAMVNQIASGNRPLPPVQNAMVALSPQQLADQVEVGLALQSLGKLPPSRFLASPVTDVGLIQSTNAFDGNIFALSPLRPETASAARSIPSSMTRASTRQPPVPLPLPQVTVVVESGVTGKAVINGRLSRVGDAVGNGMVVSSINVDSVTFSSGDEVLEVRMPLDRLRVLGAFPSPTRGN